MLMTPDNVLGLGMSLVLIGLIFYFSPRILKRHFTLCDAARQVMKQEASLLGQTDRLARLQNDEKGIARIPLYGKFFVGIGTVIFAIGFCYALYNK